MAAPENVWLDPNDYTQPHTERAVISPDLAETWLSLNTWNRKSRPSEIDKHAATMKRGEWVFNGESIKFSHPTTEEDAILIDGQHRLLACVKAQVPFETVVAFGLPPEAQKTVDIGSKRMFADTLRLSGEANSNILAAALRLFWMYDNGHLRSEKVEPAIDQMEKVLVEHPQIRNSVAVARPLTKIKTSATVGAVAHMLFSMHDRDRANEFMDMLISGVGFDTAKHPIYLLREWFRTRHEEGFQRFSRAYILVMYIKTWNHWLQGNQVGQQFLRWRTTGPRPETFPKVLDPNSL